MNRLIAFGCSHTFGHGLSDCWIEKEKTHGVYPSKYAWPTILARHMNRFPVNMGICGAAANQISNNIVRYNYRKNDIVVVLWTHTNRHSVVYQNGSASQMSAYAATLNKKSKIWLKNFYDEYDSLINYASSIITAQKFLEKNNIPSMHFIVEDIQSDVEKYKVNKFFELIDLDNNGIFFYDNPIRDVALDNAHLGPETHKWFAQEIYTYFTKKQLTDH